MSARQHRPGHATASARVLLLGDERHSVDLVRTHLASTKSMAFSVVHASRIGLVDGLAEAKEPDVVLVDLDPRESRGLELLSEVRAKFRSVPVVVMSEIEDEEFAFEALRSGADGYLAKAELSRRSLVTALGAALATQRTINELTSARERERHLATHDQLTGLPNRTFLMDRLRQAVAGARRGRETVAVLVLDLDGFRSVNDTLGHAVGDGLLRGIARQLRGCLQNCDTAARLGGDEFAIVLTQLPGEAAACEVAARILQTLAKPIPFHRGPSVTTASIGIATFPKDAQDSEELIRLADAALHHAKSVGRNRYEFYSKSMKWATAKRLALEAALRTAIEDNQLIVHYQPQFDLRRSRIIGAEALVRWQHPDLGLVSPGYFLPLAEETGLVVPIGDWVLREACRQNATWRARGHRGLRVGVNVASQQFQEPAFANTVRMILEECGLEANGLELEITEGSLLSDIEATTSTLHELREMGVRLAIDDFGTGYSSLAYLKRLPIDVLKIDQSFVRNVASDPGDATITQAIIDMAKGLGLTTIAEGVETFQQLLALGSYGCHRMQGYLFGRPVEPETLFAWLTDPPFDWSRIDPARAPGSASNENEAGEPGTPTPGGETDPESPGTL